MPLENIVGKKIELLLKELKPNQIHCPRCGGIGWLQENGKWITSCPDCYNGVIDVCPNCGKPYSRRYSRTCDNPECVEKQREKRSQEEHEKEMIRLGKAEKVDTDTAFDRFYMLYSDYYNSNEGYFTDWDSFWDAWEDHIYENDETPLEDIKRPEYAWGTSVQKLSMDADTIIEQATDDLWEGASDNCDYKGLQELLDKWCSEQTGTDSYYVDYKYAVKIPWEEYDRGE